MEYRKTEKLIRKKKWFFNKKPSVNIVVTFDYETWQLSSRLDGDIVDWNKGIFEYVDKDGVIELLQKMFKNLISSGFILIGVYNAD